MMFGCIVQKVAKVEGRQVLAEVVILKVSSGVLDQRGEDDVCHQENRPEAFASETDSKSLLCLLWKGMSLVFPG